MDPREAGYPPNGFEDEDDEFQDYWLVFQEALKSHELRYYRFIVSSRYENNHQWFRIEKSFEIPGLADTERAKFLKPLLSEDLTTVERLLKIKLQGKALKYVLPVLRPDYWDDRTEKIAKRIAKVASENASKQLKNYNVNYAANLNGGEVTGFVPGLEQFPESLTSLGVEYSDYLQWLKGSAEMSIFGLQIGRALVGPINARMVGAPEYNNHGFRYASIVQSTPGLGKTVYMETLAEAFDACGYKVEEMMSPKDRFGQAKWLSAELAYQDDSNESSLGYILESQHMKTVCSGGVVITEEKGKSHVKVKAASSMIFFANDVDTRIFSSCDSGMADRFKVLACLGLSTIYSKKLTGAMSGAASLRPLDSIDHIANRAGVSRLVSTMYFMRLCVDYFTGFSNSELIDQVTVDSENLFSSYMANGLATVAKTAVLAYLLKNPEIRRNNIDEIPFKFKGAGNSAGAILESIEALGYLANLVPTNFSPAVKGLIKHEWDLLGRPKGHPWLTFRNYTRYFLTEAGLSAKMGKDRFTSDGIDAVFEKVFKSFRNKDGDPSKFAMSRVQSAYESAVELHWVEIKNTYIHVLKTLEEMGESRQLSAFYTSKPDLAQCINNLRIHGEQPISNDILSTIKVEELPKWV